MFFTFLFNCSLSHLSFLFFFFFNDTATTEIYTLSYTLSLHDALPIYHPNTDQHICLYLGWGDRSEEHTSELQSHSEISYAVFCLKKKKKKKKIKSHNKYPTKKIQNKQTRSK